jgi:hypothetical protein
VKLTTDQIAVLKRLAIGPYYPAGRQVASANALVRRGLAAYDRAHLCFCITPAGRTALSEGGRP